MKDKPLMSFSTPDRGKKKKKDTGTTSSTTSASAPPQEGTSEPPSSKSRGSISAPSNSRASQQISTPIREKAPCWWCCCCSCCWSISSTPGKCTEDNGPNKNSNNAELLSCEGEPLCTAAASPRPTLEDIKAWGRSFDKLMHSSTGRKIFRDFLKCEYSEENILFWLACEELKRETSPEVIEEMARIIYEDYVSILSPKEVSLDARVREIVNRNMLEPTPHTFDEAQVQVYTLMHRDSYPRFVNSPFYKSMTEGEPPDEKD